MIVKAPLWSLCFTAILGTSTKLMLLVTSMQTDSSSSLLISRNQTCQQMVRAKVVKVSIVGLATPAPGRLDNCECG
jgi:hypothetical protein